MAVLCLDIGGANIKAVLGDRAVSEPFALWKNPDGLADALLTVTDVLGRFDAIAVTMTGELCDCFATKREGVCRILDAVDSLAAGMSVGVWLTDGRFGSIAEAKAQWHLAAASNWHALATFVAIQFPDGLSLLVDIGSTTTDIIRVRDGRVDCTGTTDTQRLATGELVYVGSARTPLMALGPTVMFRGREHGVMAEYFATMADAALLTGRIDAQPDNTDTADGRPMTVHCAAARLLRMIGQDGDTATGDDAVRLAEAFAAIARRRIADAAAAVLAGRLPARVIVSGSGDWLAWSALEPAVGVWLADHIGHAASTAACAHALSRLWTERMNVP